MSTNLPVFIAPKTRQWAISAVVLGILFVLMSIPGFFNYSKSVAMLGPSKAVISITISTIGMLIAVAFVACGAAVLQGNVWGREGLTYTAASAMVMTVLSTAWGLIQYHDPAFIGAFSKAAGNSALPPNFGSMMVTIMTVMFIIVAAIQLTYCFFLHRHMSADVIEPSMGYGYAHQDTGAWPPPPAS